MLTIRLVGPPAIERDGRPAPAPRGRKAWALLSYLLLAERPPSRRHLAELLFGDANDPLGALRWTLAELRRGLGVDAFGGDPVTVRLDDVAIDIDSVHGEQAEPLLELHGELLDGVSLPSCPEFESWLMMARYRVASAIEARLREAAVALLASGQPDRAVPYAQAAVVRNPHEEGNHELLVRSLAMTGDRAAARRQVAVCEDLLRREVGIEPSAALREAATAGPDTAMASPLSGRAAAESQLEAGRAAILAGAVDAGLQCLRRAVTEAARCHDTALQARATVALGGALIHAVRGRDNEGAVVLHEAIELAERAGDPATSAVAHRELAFVEVIAGRRETAGTWLAKAAALAESDAERAALLGVHGVNATDRGDYPAALRHFGESVELASRSADDRQQAWSLSHLARAHVLRDERSQAAEALARALDIVQRQRWISFLPFPQALRADLDLQDGDVDGAANGLERAWVLACQVDDPCWEGIAARGVGLLHAARGDYTTANEWLTEAATRSNRVPDRYQWMHAYVLDAAIGTALDRDDHDRARPLVATLESLAARCDMRELVVRSHVHRHRLGDRTALAAARSLAADVDNPALHELLHGS